MGNDNSPGLLPNGNIVSLWLGRSEGRGIQELKVISTGRSSYF